MKRMKKWMIALILVVVTLVIYILVSLWVSTNYIVIREYTADTGKSDTGFRAVVVSDLHDHRFGGDNEELAEKIREADPGCYHHGRRYAQCRVGGRICTS